MRPQLQTSDKNRLRSLLCGTDNLEQLLYLICLYVDEFVFALSPSGDPVDVKTVAVRRLGRELQTAILEKLRGYYPKESDKSDSTLLRYYPDRAGELLQQALSYILDLWVQDRNRSTDTLLIKCQRILPQLSCLPDLRGKSALGTTSELFGLIVYDDARTLLQKLPSVKLAPTKDDETRRKLFFATILESLLTENTGLVPPPPAIFKDIFREAAKNDYADWLWSPRTEIALEIVSKVIGQTPDYFRRSVKKLRERAATLRQRRLKSVF